MKDNIFKVITKFKEHELKSTKKDSKNKKKVTVDPNSYLVKEIEYQTALLKEIQHDISEIKRRL